MFTKDDLDAINEAIASGEQTVKIDGKEIVYRSITALQKARRMICRDLNRQAGRKSNPLAGIVTCVDRGIR